MSKQVDAYTLVMRSNPFFQIVIHCVWIVIVGRSSLVSITCTVVEVNNIFFCEFLGTDLRYRNSVFHVRVTVERFCSLLIVHRRPHEMFYGSATPWSWCATTVALPVWYWFQGEASIMSPRHWAWGHLPLNRINCWSCRGLERCPCIESRKETVCIKLRESKVPKKVSAQMNLECKHKNWMKKTYNAVR